MRRSIRLDAACHTLKTGAFRFTDELKSPAGAASNTIIDSTSASAMSRKEMIPPQIDGR